MAKKRYIKLVNTNLELHREGLRVGEIIEVTNIERNGKAWTGRAGRDIVVYPEDYELIE